MDMAIAALQNPFDEDEPRPVQSAGLLGIVEEVIFLIKSKPVRAVIGWQICATGALALLAIFWAGGHGAASAMLGGFINLSAGIVFALMTSRAKAQSADQTIRTLVRAEAVKIALIVLQLWLVLTTYKEVVPLFFFATFVVTVLLSRMALIARDI
jgi:ATP synthase protein I